MISVEDSFEIFNLMKEKILELLTYTPSLPYVNSAGINRFSTNFQFDMVRLGMDSMV